jgi:hypothetical protein
LEAKDKLPDQVMPRSGYDIDKLGPGTIWEYTVRFHDDLKLKSVQVAVQRMGGETPLYADAIDRVRQEHVREAIIEINREISLTAEISGMNKECSELIRTRLREVEDQLVEKVQKRASRTGEVNINDVRKVLRTRSFGLKELILAAGSGLIGAFLSEFLTNFPAFPSSWHFVALVIGIILVMLRRDG